MINFLITNVDLHFCAQSMWRHNSSFWLTTISSINIIIISIKISLLKTPVKHEWKRDQVNIGMCKNMWKAKSIENLSRVNFGVEWKSWSRDKTKWWVNKWWKEAGSSPSDNRGRVKIAWCASWGLAFGEGGRREVTERRWWWCLRSTTTPPAITW